MRAVVVIALLCLLGGAPLIKAAEDAAAESDKVVIDDDEYADTEKAFLVVRKSIKEEVIVQGRNMTVRLHIYNGGISAAQNVEVKDAIPPEFTLIEGSLETSVPSLKVGAAIKHTYVLVPKSGDATLVLPSAEVSYIAEAESGSIQAGRSAPLSVAILTPTQQIQRTALLVGKFASLGIFKTGADWRNFAIVVFLVSAFVGVNSTVKSVSSARTQRARKKALEELEKQE